MRRPGGLIADDEVWMTTKTLPGTGSGAPPMIRLLPDRSGFLTVLAALAALTFAGAGPAAAQIQTPGRLQTQQVSGVVLEVVGRAPVPDAVIRVQGQVDAVRSGRDGRFILRDVPAGSWLLEVTPPGRAPHTYSMDVEPGGYAVVEVVVESLGDPSSREASGIRRTRSRESFDWSQDPAGHSFGRTFLGAAAGNALGLAAGLAVGRQCVFIEDRTEEIAFSCDNAGVAGAGLAAVALPALGGAIGARLAGGTDRSRGRMVPAVVGGAMGVLPGYIFSLSTVGGGVETMNAVGMGFLLVGAPLITTAADRLFRTLR